MGKPEPRLIRTPQEAEQTAVDWMRWMGFGDARLGPRGPDGGIDVNSPRAVAQVKAQMVKTGRPEIQGLYGVASFEKKQPLFFSLNGFTDEATEWGSSAGVALFTFNLAGEVEGLNAPANMLIDQAEVGGFLEWPDLRGRDLEWADLISIFWMGMSLWNYSFENGTYFSVKGVSEGEDGVFWSITYGFFRWASPEDRERYEQQDKKWTDDVEPELRFRTWVSSRRAEELRAEWKRLLRLSLEDGEDLMDGLKRSRKVHDAWEKEKARPISTESVIGFHLSASAAVEQARAVLSDGGFALSDFELTIEGAAEEPVDLVDWLTRQAERA